MTAIVYAAATQITARHKIFSTASKSGKRHTLWIRVELSEKNDTEALFDANPRKGETILNTIDLEELEKS
jgi:hypothetical protein